MIRAGILNFTAHFFDVDLGQLLILIAILRAVDMFGLEHELLVDDYCKRHGIRRSDLITRRKSRLVTIFVGERRGQD